MLTDFRFVIRSFKKSPGFTAISVLTLAVGIGAATAMFSALRALVVEPFTYPHPDRIVQVWPKEDNALSPLNYFDVLDQASFFKELGVYSPHQANIGGEKPIAADGASCTPGVLRSFGVPPAYGRWLEPTDEEKGAPAVAVISNGLWKQSFAGDPGVVGRKVPIDGVSTTIVGIMPAGFEFASPWYRSKTCQIWLPLKLQRGTGDRGSGWLSCVGRLRDGVTVASADAQIKVIGARLSAAYPNTNLNEPFLVRSLKVEMTRYTAPQVWMLFGAVILVLLVACANVASMLLARGSLRQAEFAIRIALGASRAQIMRLVLTESLLLSLAGCVAGILLATYGVRFLALIAQTTDTRKDAMVIDASVLAFTVCATAITALVAGLPPAFSAFRLSVAEASRAQGRSVAGSRRNQKLLRGLVISQVTVAFALANIAALFSASYLKVLAANKDLSTEHVLSVEVDLNGSRYDKIEDRTRVAEQLAERASALPGVIAAGITSKLPLEGGSNSTILVNDQVFDPRIERPMAEISSITPGYFAAAGIRLLKGRTLQAGDSGQDNIGVVVNRALADKCWPGLDPIGKIIRPDFTEANYHARVVGVVENVKQWGPKSEPNPEIYWALDRAWGQTIFLIVSSPRLSAQIAPLIRSELASIDSDLPMSHVRTLGDIVRESSKGDKAVATVVDFFMATALGLVAVGLYGTLSFCVLQRTREIGIRMAIGAERRSILGLVFRQGLAWVLVGMVAGAAGSVALAAALRALIWGVNPLNIYALLGSAGVVASAAIIACWLPAWRAAGVEPIVALRAD